MTAALSLPLQRALYAHLTSDPAVLAALGGPHLYDAPPHADAPGARRGRAFVLIGEERVDPWFDQSADGAEHRLQFRVVSFSPGFSEAKRIAGALSDALLGPPPALERGRIVRVQFLGSEARRGGAGGADGAAELVSRRVDLRFRAILEDDPAP